MTQIIQHPDPRLRQVSEPVTDFTEVFGILADMRTALAFPTVKALGLAAIQVGIAKRVILLYQDGHEVVMVNPVIVKQSGVQTVKDGCLSVQHGRMFKARTRPHFVMVEYQDLHGNPQRRKARGINAAAIAHELEHLEGKLFLDVFESPVFLEARRG
jgi:peptide deformylase